MNLQKLLVSENQVSPNILRQISLFNPKLKLYDITSFINLTAAHAQKVYSSIQYFRMLLSLDFQRDIDIGM
jgi:hypothetical protein